MTVSRTVSLGEVCEFVGGGTPSRKQPEYFQGDIPWATVKDFKSLIITDTEEHISEAAIASSATNVIEPGTVLLVSRVGLGKVAIAGRRLAINQDIKAIIPTGGIEPEFLFWFLLSKAGDIQRMGAGATVKGITLNDIKSIKMPVPPVSEQRRIVDLLSRAEGIVRLRREAEKKAAELIPALFLDMFGDPATNPKGWLASTLGEVAVVQGGLQVTTARAELPLERPYLRVANVHRSRLELGEIKQIRLTQAELERTRLSVGDLLVVEGHGNADEIGRVAIWDGSINDCVHQNHLIRVRPNPDAIYPSYACEFLNSHSGRQFLLRSGKTTSGLTTISVSNVKAATILLPEISLQQKFATRVESVRSIQTQQCTATTKAQIAFDALLARVFSES